MNFVNSYLLLILSLSNVMAQNAVFHGEVPSSECIEKHKRKLTKKFKKTECFDPQHELKFLFIYLYGFEQRPTPELLLEPSIANKLDILYRKNTSFPINYTIIYNDEKQVKGYVEYLDKVYCFNNRTGSLLKEYEILLDYFFRQNPEIILQIDVASSNIYFAGQEDKLKALLFKDENLYEMEMQEFVECCWDNSFPKDILDIHYSN